MHDKRALDLVALLNDVLTYLDESHRRDVRTEDPAQRGPRITEFLRDLKYGVPDEPEQQCVLHIDRWLVRKRTAAHHAGHARRAAFLRGVTEGNADVIHPILQYLLTRLEVLKKRAYVAKFLVRVSWWFDGGTSGT